MTLQTVQLGCAIVMTVLTLAAKALAVKSHCKGGSATLASDFLVPRLLDFAGGAIFEAFQVKNTPSSEDTGGVWANARTKGHVTRAIRALKLHALKQSANTSSRFFGVSSKSTLMVFTLKKFPSSLKAFQIILPNAIGVPCEGFFLKTVKGKKVLSVNFGNADLCEDALVHNAMALANTVRTVLDIGLVREITVAVDKLVLPVWNRKLWEHGKHRLSARPSGRRDTKKQSMPPPMGYPSKSLRIV